MSSKPLPLRDLIFVLVICVVWAGHFRLTRVAGGSTAGFTGRAWPVFLPGAAPPGGQRHALPATDAGPGRNPVDYAAHEAEDRTKRTC
jgi:hypothetical protein